MVKVNFELFAPTRSLVAIVVLLKYSVKWVHGQAKLQWTKSIALKNPPTDAESPEP